MPLLGVAICKSKQAAAGKSRLLSRDWLGGLHVLAFCASKIDTEDQEALRNHIEPAPKVYANAFGRILFNHWQSRLLKRAWPFGPTCAMVVNGRSNSPTTLGHISGSRNEPIGTRRCAPGVPTTLSWKRHPQTSGLLFARN